MSADLFPTEQPASPRQRPAILLAILLVVAGILTAGAVWLLASASTPSWNEKVTLSVQTPQGIVSATGVWGYSVVDDRPVRTVVSGEAIPLEIAPGVVAVLLLGGPYIGTMDPNVHHEPGSYDAEAHMAGVLQRKGQPAATSDSNGQPFQYTVVTFLDSNDPTSVRTVEGGDLSLLLGPGYQVPPLTAEVTDEPVTEGRLIGVLGWWSTYTGGPFQPAHEMRHLEVPTAIEGARLMLPTHRFWSPDLLGAMQR